VDQYIPLNQRFQKGYPSILFLHGHISRLDTVLITSEQYDKLYITRNVCTPKGTNIAIAEEFRKDFIHQPDFNAIFHNSEVEILFFGMEPTNQEFKGLVTSFFGTDNRDIFVLFSTDVNKVFLKFIKILTF